MSKPTVSVLKPGISTNKLTNPQQASVFCGIDVSGESSCSVMTGLLRVNPLGPDQ